ncbi:MAG TPA: hypothetical protein VIL18_10325 [Longimicrobiales bacterium]
MRRVAGLFLLSLVLVACGDDDGSGPQEATFTLDSIAPQSGTAGTEITVYGGGLAAEDSFRVFFDTLESPRVQRAGGQLYALAPAGLEAGTTYDVRVERVGGGAETLAAAYTAVPPTVLRVNGASKTTGLVGMTILLEGAAFGDDMTLAEGRVFFRGAGGSAIQATIANPASDWADGFIVTAVPAGTADTSLIWVETATGASDSVEFRLITTGSFSPSVIDWTLTTPLPQPLAGPGAAFVRVEAGAAPADYVFVLGGADTLGVATTTTVRARVLETGALESWETAGPPLPEARAYHATAVATPFTAPLDTLTAAVVYVLGGKDANDRTVSGVLAARVGLDGDISAWQPMTPLPQPLHSAGVAVFRGYVYLAGGADTLDAAVADAYRARIGADGALGPWEPIASLPQPTAYAPLIGFGPYLYLVGGETGTSAPARSTLTTSETASVRHARIDLRTGNLDATGWATLPSVMAKARSKHASVVGGGVLFTTSGVYSGNPGSSENTYAPINADGTSGSWLGATGAETIQAETGYALYNQAAVYFVNSAGDGHVIVLGGANRTTGRASAAVVYY